MLETLEKLDQELFLWLNAPHSEFLDALMWYVSAKWIWIPLYLLFLWYAFKKGGWKFAIYVLLGAVASVALADLISVNAFKEVFQRYRPTHNTEIGEMVKTVVRPNGEIYKGGLYGFVSSHAANMSAITTFLLFSFLQFSKKWWWLVFWPLLIMYSRIYLGVHYPSDVFVGAMVGISVGILVSLSSKKLKQKFSVST
ncbi:MAG: phosphatase PAP2 family protein [Crocinitomicaceae bacterium]|nr:phosphatase PAP2 family protein [Crocinitomicaceae bacterium]